MVLLFSLKIIPIILPLLLNLIKSAPFIVDYIIKSAECRCGFVQYLWLYEAFCEFAVRAGNMLQGHVLRLPAYPKVESG
jgi:hypothetical protein